MNNEEKKNNIERRMDRILEIVSNMLAPLGRHVEDRFNEDIQIHFHGYGEPGYDSKYGIIATGNWNSIEKYDEATRSHIVISNVPERVLHLFEKMGIECEWDDEWEPCCNCGVLLQSEGEGDWRVLCAKCVAEGYRLTETGDLFFVDVDEEYNE